MRAPFVFALFALLLAPCAARAQVAAELGSPVASPDDPAPSREALDAEVDVPAPPGAYGPSSPSAPPPARPARGGYMPEWPLLVPGLVAFVSTYGGAVMAGVQAEITYGGSSVTDWLFAPIVGPFALVYFADGVPEAQAGFAILGLFQTAAIAFIIAGLAINRRARAPATPAISFSLGPVVTPVGASLTFGATY